MKTYLFIPLLMLAPLAQAQDKVTVATAPAENRQVSLSIFKGQPSLVRDIRTVTLPAGRVVVQFPEVPKGDDLDRDSLQLGIDPAVKVLRQENLYLSSPGYSLANFIGKQVTLLRPQTEVGGTGKAVTGTLLSVGSTTLLDTADGVLLNPSGVWVLPREGKEHVGEPGSYGFRWQVNSAHAGDFPAQVTYATSKLSWDARYTATLAPTLDRLKLRGWLTFNNATSTTFTNAKLALRDTNGQALAVPAATTLTGGETQLTYVDVDVPVSESLIYEAGTQGNFSQAVNGAHPLRSMTLENSAANGLGLYLPKGSLSLWQGQDEKTLDLTKSPVWGDFRGGDIISIPLGSNPDIFMDRVIVSSKLLNPVTREIVVTWKLTSTSMTARSVTLLDDVPSRYKLTNTTLKPASEINDQLRFEVKVAGDKPVEFRYTVEVPA